MPDILDVLTQADQGFDASLRKLLKVVAIPSISSDPEGAPGIAEAADWLQRELTGMGLDARVCRTPGHPLILAHSRPEDSDAGPHLLFYGHYDVQPVGEAEAWTRPPFAPEVVDEGGVQRFYGRGASDSKSQFWSFIEALRAWKTVRGRFPCRITVLLEGEEESGSESLPAFIEAHRAELACDVAFICDSDMWSPDVPAITTQLKGLLHEKVTIHGPNPDLHSGYFGAVAANPIRVLAGIIAEMHDADGRVAIPGFYDGVPDIPPALRRVWAGLAEAAHVLESTDLTGGVIEAGYAPLEAIWGRPTLDLNGVAAGNLGPGERSVLPGSATARLSFRLVGGQDPQRIRALFRAFVTARLPQGCRAEFEGSEGSPAVVTPLDNPFMQAMAQALNDEWQQETIMKGSGGSIPLVQLFQDRLGVDCIVLGFILSTDAIHAPDEHYDLRRLKKGIRSWVRLLDKVRGLEPGAP